MRLIFFMETFDCLHVTDLVGVHFYPGPVSVSQLFSGSRVSWFWDPYRSLIGSWFGLLGGLSSSLPGDWVRSIISVGLTFFWCGVRSPPCPSLFGLFCVGCSSPSPEVDWSGSGRSTSVIFLLCLNCGNCRSLSRRRSFFWVSSMTVISYFIMGCLGISRVLIGPRLLGRRKTSSLIQFVSCWSGISVSSCNVTPFMTTSCLGVGWPWDHFLIDCAIDLDRTSVASLIREWLHNRNHHNSIDQYVLGWEEAQVVLDEVAVDWEVVCLLQVRYCAVQSIVDADC